MSNFATQLRFLHLCGYRIEADLSWQSTVTTELLKFSNLFSIVFCCTAECWFIVKNITDVKLAVEAAVLMSLTLIAFAKVIIFGFWKDKILKLIVKLDKMASEGELVQNV
jgi:hypothetical protein